MSILYVYIVDFAWGKVLIKEFHYYYYSTNKQMQ